MKGDYWLPPSYYGYTLRVFPPIPYHQACFACKVFHTKAAFTEAMLHGAEDRICIGSTLALPSVA